MDLDRHGGAGGQVAHAGADAVLVRGGRLDLEKKDVDLNLSVGFDYVQNRYNALLITT